MSCLSSSWMISLEREAKYEPGTTWTALATQTDRLSLPLSVHKGRIPWIVLLSGTTSSGKTTLSRAVQHRLSRPERPFLHIEADRFVPDQPKDLVGGLADPLHRAMYQAIAAYADQGFDLIVDGILPYGHPESIADALSTFRLYRLCYVGVHCDLDILEQREKERPDRVTGWASHQFRDLHDRAEYDVEVDTTATSPIVNADRVAEYLILRDDDLGKFMTG